jgi:hypothetical protein
LPALTNGSLVDEVAWGDLDPLLTAMQSERTDAISSYYTTLARQLAARPDLEVLVADGDSYYELKTERLVVAAFARGDEHSLGTANWAAVLHGEFWHELGHVLYSQRIFEFDPGGDPDLEETANLLEDIRMERRLLREHRSEAEPWLRFTLLFDRSTDDLCDYAAIHGWPRICSAYYGRRHAGVIRSEEARLIAGISDETQAVVGELNATWAEFAALGDEEVNEPRAHVLIHDLAQYL